MSISQFHVSLLRADSVLTWIALFIATIPSAVCARQFVEISTPQQDTLLVDEASVRKNGDIITFDYVLDVLAAAEGRSGPGGWKSNEGEISIDCVKRTYSISRVIAHSGRQASGTITGTYTVPIKDRRPEPIPPASTFAYLADHVCGKRQ